MTHTLLSFFVSFFLVCRTSITKEICSEDTNLLEGDWERSTVISGVCFLVLFVTWTTDLNEGELMIPNCSLILIRKTSRGSWVNYLSCVFLINKGNNFWKWHSSLDERNEADSNWVPSIERHTFVMLAILTWKDWLPFKLNKTTGERKFRDCWRRVSVGWDSWWYQYRLSLHLLYDLTWNLIFLVELLTCLSQFVMYMRSVANEWSPRIKMIIIVIQRHWHTQQPPGRLFLFKRSFKLKVLPHLQSWRENKKLHSWDTGYSSGKEERNRRQD